MIVTPEPTMRKQPTCPACRSSDLRLEDATTGRAQCQRCLWRCVIERDGKTRDWLDLGVNRAVLLPSMRPPASFKEVALPFPDATQAPA